MTEQLRSVQKPIITVVYAYTLATIISKMVVPLDDETPRI